MQDLASSLQNLLVEGALARHCLSLGFGSALSPLWKLVGAGPWFWELVLLRDLLSSVQASAHWASLLDAGHTARSGDRPQEGSFYPSCGLVSARRAREEPGL